MIAYLLLTLVCYIQVAFCQSNAQVPIKTKVVFSDDESKLNKFHSLTVPYAIFNSNGTLKHLRLSIDGFRIQLDLEAVADKSLFDLQGATSEQHALSKNCHYRSINDEIYASISNCEGFYKGIVMTKTGIYSLEPLVSNEFGYETLIRSKSTSLHALYKREIPETFCGSAKQEENHTRIRREDDASLEVDIAQTARLSKRADLTVEIALFVDSRLYRVYVDKFGGSAESELKDFVTAMMNNIQILYQHPSMTPKMTFKVVRYEIFRNQPYELRPTQILDGDAQAYLDEFCLYQYNMRERTWDHSFLLTGYDMVRNGNDKSISGISRLWGVCDTYNSCTISEGLDFSAAFIGAHEIGHALGMIHDEPNCPSQFIMSNSLGPGKITWSSCSINDLRKYLDKLDYQGKNCLRNRNFETTDLTLDGNFLPGQRFNADAQCALFHGAGYRKVTPTGDNSDGPCYMTWCGLTTFGRILTSHPALEGTYCDNGKYCIQGRCAPFSTSNGPVIIDGSWSSWGYVSCSQCVCPVISNGIGMLKSSRTCTNPSPQNGGRNCNGDRVRGIVCSNASCKKPTRSVETYIKAVCSNHKRVKNDLELTGDGSNLTKEKPRACKVFCDIESSSSGQKNFRFFGDFLPDGSPCGTGRYCVDGECLTLDCGDAAAVNERYSCPSSSSEACPVVSTPPPEAWTQWSVWSICSVTCGTGYQMRTRSCYVGTCSGSNEDRFTCNLPSCSTASSISSRVIEVWSSWGTWTSCSTSCGDGTRARYRQCNSSPCTGSNIETNSCNNAACYTDREWAPWSTWSSCSVTCGSGTKNRGRACKSGSCSGSTSESVSCDRGPCNNGIRDDAEWGGWSSWSNCGGTRIARRRIRDCYGGNKNCPGTSFEEKPCWS